MEDESFKCKDCHVLILCMHASKPSNKNPTHYNFSRKTCYFQSRHFFFQTCLKLEIEGFKLKLLSVFPVTVLERAPKRGELEYSRKLNKLHDIVIIRHNLESKFPVGFAKFFWMFQLQNPVFYPASCFIGSKSSCYCHINNII